MPRIDQLRPVLLSAPYGSPWSTERTQRLPTGYRNCSMVELSFDDGLTGIGEGYLGVFAPQVFASIAELLAEVVVGRDLADAKAIVCDIELAANYWSAQGAARHVISAIEIALWDARGKSAGKPLHAMLSAEGAQPIKLYGSGGSVRRSTDLTPELDLLASLGIDIIKIRSQKHQSALALDAVSFAATRGIRTAVDMIQNLALPSQSVEQAAEFVAGLEAAGAGDLVFLEEPFGPDKPEAFSQLRQRCRVPIAGGEIITTPAEMCRMIEAGSYDICQPDATVIGGIGATLTIARHAQERGVETVVHAWGGAACLMANYHCAFTIGARLAEYPIPPFALREAMMTEPLTIQAGQLLPPTASGLGVRLDSSLEREFSFRGDAAYRCIPVRI